MENFSYIVNKKAMFKIYHIKGIKIGCTTQPKGRVREQGFSNYEILEEHDDIYIASDREQELQKQYGYKVDECPYWVTYELNAKRRSKLTEDIKYKAGKKAGDMNVESGWIKKFQQRSVLARTGTKHSDETKMKIKLTRLGKNTYPSIPVLVFDKENNFISEYTSAASLCKALNLRQGNVSSVLNEKLQTTGGYKIKYK
jgi:hypothetical protein